MEQLTMRETQKMLDEIAADVECIFMSMNRLEKDQGGFERSVIELQLVVQRSCELLQARIMGQLRRDAEIPYDKPLNRC